MEEGEEWTERFWDCCDRENEGVLLSANGALARTIWQSTTRSTMTLWRPSRRMRRVKREAIGTSMACEEWRRVSSYTRRLAANTGKRMAKKAFGTIISCCCSWSDNHCDEINVSTWSRIGRWEKNTLLGVCYGGSGWIRGEWNGCCFLAQTIFSMIQVLSLWFPS